MPLLPLPFPSHNVTYPLLPVSCACIYPHTTPPSPACPTLPVVLALTAVACTMPATTRTRGLLRVSPHSMCSSPRYTCLYRAPLLPACLAAMHATSHTARLQPLFSLALSARVLFVPLPAFPCVWLLPRAFTCTTRLLVRVAHSLVLPFYTLPVHPLLPRCYPVLAFLPSPFPFPGLLPPPPPLPTTWPFCPMSHASFVVYTLQPFLPTTFPFIPYLPTPCCPTHTPYAPLPPQNRLPVPVPTPVQVMVPHCMPAVPCCLLWFPSPLNICAIVFI